MCKCEKALRKLLRERLACFTTSGLDLNRRCTVDASSKLEAQVTTTEARFSWATLFLWLSHSKCSFS